jgi:hypothetical protein
MEQEKKVSIKQRWGKARATKTAVFWIVIGAIILTMIVGFNWGGWVTGSTAQRMADTTAQGAVIQRLSLICVGQFNQDLQKTQKLTELKAEQAYLRDDYVRDQGWATMSGEEKPDNKVSDACAKQLVQISQ